jgi:hypothetical protein
MNFISCGGCAKDILSPPRNTVHQRLEDFSSMNSRFDTHMQSP